MTKETAVVTTPEDDFTAAFAQFGTDEAPVITPAPDDVTPEVTDTANDDTTGDEAPPADDAPDGTPPALDATPEAAQGSEDTQPSDTASATSDDDLLVRLAALVKQTPATKDAEPQTTPPTDVEPELYTPEEQTFLSEYEKDWPDVAKAESLRRRAEYRDLVNHVFSEVAKEIVPIAQTMRMLAERAQLTDLREAVEDYDDVRDKVVDWVNNQPKYLQTAYKYVIQHGTPDEVADLVTRYKKEAAPVTPSVSAKKAESELPTTTKQAVAALAPVSSKRSTVIAADDPNDFESAFAAAAKMT